MRQLDNLREVMRRDRVFDVVRPGFRTIQHGAIDTGHGPILHIEEVSVSFDGFKASMSHHVHQ